MPVLSLSFLTSVLFLERSMAQGPAPKPWVGGVVDDLNHRLFLPWFVIS